MLRPFAALLIALSPLPLAAQPMPPLSAQPMPPKVAEALPAIDRLFADFQIDSHAPGLVYGVVADGRLVHMRALGVQDLKARRPVTSESLFRIASCRRRSPGSPS
jgi:CubicO group peptidase (beta-lactamase class C family)